MVILFNFKNIKNFFNNRENERLESNIRYNWNAVYKYRWTIMISFTKEIILLEIII